jgi:uncharacterized hydrophobic protein (TIGR00341 family)
MPLRILEISAPDAASKAINALSKDHGAIDHWHSAKNKDGRRTTSILVHLDQQQALMDDLQKKLNKEKDWRIAVLPVEATIPKPEPPTNGDHEAKARKLVRGTITREELYSEVEKGAQIDQNFILLVLISALVAAIGLTRNDVAVIIGAMVIAPLLGPNIALAFGAALGDRSLMSSAIKTNALGLSLTIAVSALLSLVLPLPLDSPQLLSRTEIGLELIILALASGAAGVLSLTTGLSGAMVGVMVAVALMPPAVAAGLYLGGGLWGDAYNAFLLLATNIVCVNLAAQIIFFFRGIKPRTYYKRKKSEQSVKYNLAFWAALLLAVAGLILLRA